MNWNDIFKSAVNCYNKSSKLEKIPWPAPTQPSTPPPTDTWIAWQKQKKKYIVHYNNVISWSCTREKRKEKKRKKKNLPNLSVHPVKISSSFKTEIIFFPTNNLSNLSYCVLCGKTWWKNMVEKHLSTWIPQSFFLTLEESEE